MKQRGRATAFAALTTHYLLNALTHNPAFGDWNALPILVVTTQFCLATALFAALLSLHTILLAVVRIFYMFFY